jgi:hypothetical protein
MGRSYGQLVVEVEVFAIAIEAWELRSITVDEESNVNFCAVWGREEMARSHLNSGAGCFWAVLNTLGTKCPSLIARRGHETTLRIFAIYSVDFNTSDNNAINAAEKHSHGIVIKLLQETSNSCSQYVKWKIETNLDICAI